MSRRREGVAGPGEVADVQDKFEALQRQFLTQILSLDPDANFPRLLTLWHHKQGESEIAQISDLKNEDFSIQFLPGFV